MANPANKSDSNDGTWIVEVGCSREIVEGQNSSAALIEFARSHNFNYLGIDLDSKILKPSNLILIFLLFLGY